MENKTQIEIVEIKINTAAKIKHLLSEIVIKLPMIILILGLIATYTLTINTTTIWQYICGALVITSYGSLRYARTFFFEEEDTPENEKPDEETKTFELSTKAYIKSAILSHTGFPYYADLIMYTLILAAVITAPIPYKWQITAVTIAQCVYYSLRKNYHIWHFDQIHYFEADNKTEPKN